MRMELTCRALRCLVAFCALFLLLAAMTLPAFAADAEAILGAEIDPEAGLSGEVTDKIGPYDGAVEGFGAKVLDLFLQTLGSLPDSGIKEGLRTLGILLTAALFCALLEDSEKGRGAAPLVGALTIGAACVGGFSSMITLGTETIRSLQRYMELLLPGMGTLMAAGGNLSGSALSGLGILLFELLLKLVSGLAVPLLYLFLLISIAGSALNLDQLSGLQNLVKWLLVSLVKLLMWCYSGILTATGLITGVLDAQKLRTLRTAIAGMVPVVGNLVSEASASLLSAASVLRTAAGLYGMLAVLGICLGPFFRIGFQYLLLRLGTALCGLFGKGTRSKLLEDLTQAMGLVLALTGIACLMALMILVLCIRTVSP